MHASFGKEVMENIAENKEVEKLAQKIADMDKEEREKHAKGLCLHVSSCFECAHF